MSQVQRLGRQILEALLFLRERGFPAHGHLHSGNVILQNGVARYIIYDLFTIIFHTCVNTNSMDGQERDGMSAERRKKNELLMFVEFQHISLE